MRSKTVFLITILVALLGFLFASCSAPPPEVIHWKVQSFVPPGDFTQDNQITPMFESWETESGGRLEVEIFPADTIADFFGIGDAVSTGALDAAFYDMSFFGKIPSAVGESRTQPFLWESVEDFYEVYYGTRFGEIIKEHWAVHNIYCVGPEISSPMVLQTTFPVHELADLKGRKISTWIVPYLFNAAGAEAVLIPIEDLYLGLKLGTVEGSVHSIPELDTQGYKEVIKYVIMSFAAYPLGDYIVNMDSWNALPADLQETIERLVKDDVIPGAHMITEYQNEILEESGVTVITLSDDEALKWKKVVMEGWDILAAENPEAAEIIGIVKDYYGLD